MKYKVTNPKGVIVHIAGIGLKPGESIVLDERPHYNDLLIEEIEGKKNKTKEVVEDEFIK